MAKTQARAGGENGNKHQQCPGNAQEDRPARNETPVREEVEQEYAGDQPQIDNQVIHKQQHRMNPWGVEELHQRQDAAIGDQGQGDKERHPIVRAAEEDEPGNEDGSQHYEDIQADHIASISRSGYPQLLQRAHVHCQNELGKACRQAGENKSHSEQGNNHPAQPGKRQPVPPGRTCLAIQIVVRGFVHFHEAIE